MAYRIKKNEGIGRALRRVAHEQVHKAMASSGRFDEPHAAVHDVRKRCKKCRALLRLVRDGLGDRYAIENQVFRDAAGRLAPFRDARVVLRTYDRLLAPMMGTLRCEDFDPVRQGLVTSLAADDEHREDALRPALDRFGHAMALVDTRIDAWTVDGKPKRALRKGLERTYRRARRGLQTAAESRQPEDFHRFRKRAKYHWYQLRLIEPISGSVGGDRIDRMKELSGLLGHTHDLAVLETRLEALRSPANDAPLDVLIALSVRRRVGLETSALALGRRLFAASGPPSV